MNKVVIAAAAGKVSRRLEKKRIGKTANKSVTRGQKEGFILFYAGNDNKMRRGEWFASFRQEIADCAYGQEKHSKLVLASPKSLQRAYEVERNRENVTVLHDGHYGLFRPSVVQYAG